MNLTEIRERGAAKYTLNVAHFQLPNSVLERPYTLVYAIYTIRKSSEFGAKMRREYAGFQHSTG